MYICMKAVPGGTFFKVTVEEECVSTPQAEYPVFLSPGDFPSVPVFLLD